MEARKITIVDTRTDNVITIMSSATTLGELKVDLEANNIPYAGMDFYEGISHTSMSANDAQLPQNVMRRGVPTNELVFQLSTQNKKIKSGAMTRAEVYAEIKKLLAKEPSVVRYFKNGNYTRTSTVELISILDAHKESVKPATKKEVATVAATKKVESTTSCECGSIKKALVKLIDTLEEEDAISEYEATDIKLMLQGPGSAVKPAGEKVESPYSKAELMEMFK